MAKLVGWRCDICHKTFFEGDSGFSGNARLDLIITINPQASEDEFVFADTCINCRAEIANEIGKKIDSLRE